MFKNKIEDIINCLLIFIISLILVLDLFINAGEPASFDQLTHLTNISLFYESLIKGQFPVTWTDGFANYGMPLGLMAQQTTSYLGAIINLFTNNILLSYNLVILLGAFLSCLFFYKFLRLYFSDLASLVGAILFNFAPYRIINIYIRGALPEFFAGVFLPLVLIGIYYLLAKYDLRGFLILSLSTGLLILTHPMMFVIFGFIFLPYALLLILKKLKIKNKLNKKFIKNTNLIIKQNKHLIKYSLFFLVSLFVGIGLSGYFFIPLSYELKYFNYGLSSNHFVPNQSMTFGNYFPEVWHYFYKGDIFPRGHHITAGIIEVITIIASTIVTPLLIIKKVKIPDLFFMLLIIAYLLIFLMSPYGIIFYQKINLLGNTQHQWRLFSSFIFISPFLSAYFIDIIIKKNNPKRLYLLVIVIIFSICLLRFPQLYGKNYTLYPETRYFFTPYNLHGNIFNTVWTSATEKYPIKINKPEIISGKGIIENQLIKPSSRYYKINAKTDLRMADYTFYFPGWHAYVDNNETNIQFQDPEYRGIITYNVPKGKHEVSIIFKDTKIRILGKIITLMSILLLFIIILIIKFFNKKNYDKK